MSTPFDPKQLEAQARAFTEKFFTGVSEAVGAAARAADEAARNEHAEPKASMSEASDVPPPEKPASNIGAQFDALREEIKAGLDAQLRKFLQDMNVATQEDYELQRAMLSQAQTRIIELEQRLAELQAQINTQA